MPTVKPRINVTLEPETYAILKDLARLQGSSMSSIVAELVALSVPGYARVLNHLQQVDALKKEQQAEIVMGFDLASKGFQALLDECINNVGDMGHFLRELKRLESSEEGSEDGSESSSPYSSNTGARHQL